MIRWNNLKATLLSLTFSVSLINGYYIYNKYSSLNSHPTPCNSKNNNIIIYITSPNQNTVLPFSIVPLCFKSIFYLQNFSLHFDSI